MIFAIDVLVYFIFKLNHDFEMVFASLQKFKTNKYVYSTL